MDCIDPSRHRSAGRADPPGRGAADDWIVPRWDAPPGVRALATTRRGGVSAGTYGDACGAALGLNLGTHVGDDPACVARNRAILAEMLPGPVRWLEQVHGVAVHDADRGGGHAVPVADAAVTTRSGVVLAVMTADCLPVLLADSRGEAVAVAHAGWRGLAAGVLEAAVAALRARVGPDAALSAWLGAAIGPTAYEVGDEVRAEFLRSDPSTAAGFAAGAAPGKWWCDLYSLARMRLAASGVASVAGGGWCTAGDPERFYSHRRDGRTGRMASLVWIGR